MVTKAKTLILITKGLTEEDTEAEVVTTVTVTAKTTLKVEIRTIAAVTTTGGRMISAETTAVAAETTAVAGITSTPTAVVTTAKVVTHTRATNPTPRATTQVNSSRSSQISSSLNRRTYSKRSSSC